MVFVRMVLVCRADTNVSVYQQRFSCRLTEHNTDRQVCVRITRASAPSLRHPILAHQQLTEDRKLCTAYPRRIQTVEFAPRNQRIISNSSQVRHPRKTERKVKKSSERTKDILESKKNPIAIYGKFEYLQSVRLY